MSSSDEEGEKMIDRQNLYFKIILLTERRGELSVFRQKNP